MRTIDQIEHPVFRITIMKMNDKHLLRVEAGPYEQVYKFTPDMAEGPADIRRLVDDAFLEKVKALFDGMHGHFLPAVRKLKGRD